MKMNFATHGSFRYCNEFNRFIGRRIINFVELTAFNCVWSFFDLGALKEWSYNFY